MFFFSWSLGCTGLSESIHVKMPHCWKSHVAVQNFRTFTVEIKSSPFEGIYPIGVFSAIPSSPFTRLIIQSSTRMLSPNPGQRNFPSLSTLNQLTWKILGTWSNRDHINLYLLVLYADNYFPKYTMHNKFSNCFVWVSPSTSDLKFHLLSWRYKRWTSDKNFHRLMMHEEDVNPPNKKHMLII